MAVIKELKSLWGVTGALSGIKNAITSPMKAIREAIMIGLPSWDPPEPVPPRPPDQATVDRVKEVIGMSTLQERRAFDKIMQTWRQIKDGQPPQPAQVPGRRELPPPGLDATHGPSPKQEEA